MAGKGGGNARGRKSIPNGFARALSDQHKINAWSIPEARDVIANLESIARYSREGDESEAIVHLDGEQLGMAQVVTAVLMYVRSLQRPERETLLRKGNTLLQQALRHPAGSPEVPAMRD